MKNILFLTSTNLAANPRLLKELKLATANGYSATVIQFSIGNWSDEMTKQLMQEFPTVQFIELSAMRSPFMPWLLSSILQKLYSLLPSRFLTNKMLSIATGKRSLLLLRQLHEIKEKYDWIVAHNPATFYPALFFSKKIGAKLGIDVEDYHPGETKDMRQSAFMIKLMQEVLPQADYCSYASPLIKKEVHSVIRIPSNNNQFVIINGFDQNDFTVPAVSNTSALKVVWFSQYIDFERGLEKIIPVINSLSPEVELHLIGNLRPGFAKNCLQNTTGIILHGIMKQKELHQFLARFDVGLAVEPGKDRNNQLAISNKLIAYLQSGLFPVISATDAQLGFLKEQRIEIEHELLPESDLAIRKMFLKLIAEKKRIRDNSKIRFNVSREFDWVKLYSPLSFFWNKSG